MIIRLNSRSVTLPTRLSIPRESFVVSPTPSTFYALRGGLGTDRGGGVVDGVALAISGKVDGSGKG